MSMGNRPEGLGDRFAAIKSKPMDRDKLRELADYLENPDSPVLLAYEAERLVEALGWPRTKARTVPGGEAVEGWQSPRSTLFTRTPKLGYSFDDSMQILPYRWEWLKRPTPIGAEFAVFDDNGREVGICPILRSPRHGLPTRDAAALTAAALRALAEDNPHAR